MELDRQLSELSRTITGLRNQLAREEGQLETLRAQREDIVTTCKKRGIVPEALGTVIAQKKKQLAELLTNIDGDLSQIEKRRGEVFEASGSEAAT